MSDGWRQDERLFLHLGNERETFGSGRRYFNRGGVKYALLELLEQENMHGYQMMKALEEQSGGTYKPSAGSIYPTLQMLRDQGFVEASKVDGKKIFNITDAGRIYLQEEKEQPEPSESAELESSEPAEPEWDRREQNPDEHENGPPDGVRRNRRLTPKGKELIHLMKAAERAAMADASKAVKLREIIANLREALVRMTAEPESISE
ncbi:PadR family transcriptional regulator [Paenibacillus harenae]|uniref:PadR family transcriptional regulator n=1 Tax=Paenibacillus harenae TaxID=306543 RepID=UPI0003FB8AB5|nr:PadR family transcriptional regulator [Paenibacillus harenae]